MVTLPGFPLPRWPTAPLTTFGYPALGYQRLPNFSPYYIPYQNPFLKLDENIYRSSYKEIGIEKINNNNNDNNKIKENNVNNLANLVALAHYNENLKSIEKNKREFEKLQTKEDNNKYLVEVIPAQVLEISDTNKNNTKYYAPTVESTTSNPKPTDHPKTKEKESKKSEVEVFHNEQETQNAKIIQDTVQNSKLDKKLNDSTIITQQRIQKQPSKQNSENLKQDLKSQNLKNRGKQHYDPNAPFFAPWKNHPQFNYLKNKHTLDTSKLIQFKTEETINDKNTVTLILKPIARAIAGLEGRAMATPLARAVVERGTNADILFEPDAVAIVGPGGIAHAQSDLEIGYIE